MEKSQQSNLLIQLSQVNYLVYDNKTLPQSAWCSIPFNEEPTGSVYMMLASTIIYFFAPLFIVGILYTKYGNLAWANA